MQTIRLYDRHGSFVGYCDVQIPQPDDLPTLPEVVSPKEASGRVFIRFLDSTDYREATFDWGFNFRLIRQRPIKPSNNQHPKWERWKSICPKCGSSHTSHKSGCREYDVQLQCTDCRHIFTLNEAFEAEQARQM
jgi:predicted RNA-binding Zn-ribbon protein involved in translation (DUF1610 family)